MKLAVDITFLQDQYANRGIGRYGKEMIGRLVEKASKGKLPESPEMNALDSDNSESDTNDENSSRWEIHFIGFGNFEDNLRQLHTKFDDTQIARVANAPGFKFHSLGKAKLSRPLSNLRMYKQRIKPLVETIKPDIYWAMHFDRGVPSELTKTIVTVHDVIPLVTGEFSKQGFFINFLKGQFYKAMWRKVHKAKLVLTSSNFSKHDLVNYGDLDPKQIKTVYLGITEAFYRKNIPVHTKQQIELLARYDIQTTIKAGEAVVTPYIFYDGGLEANKNVGNLLQVFAKLVSHVPDLRLLITGGDFNYDPSDKSSRPMNERAKQFLDQAASLGVIQNLIPTGKLSDVEMSILLAHAEIYMNLSSYEGFGFGPLQAMAAEVPAVISDLSCFPEISGAAAVLVEPSNVLATTAKALEVISSDETKADLIKKGHKHVHQFNWDNTFSETWGYILGVLSTQEKKSETK